MAKDAKLTGTHEERRDTEVGTVKKRGRAWLSLPKTERNQIILNERFSQVAGGTSIAKLANVYFIKEPISGAIKIGIAADVKYRLQRLQTAHPYPLELIGHCPGGIKLERELHAEFSSQRLSGEWFSPSDNLHKRISELLAE